MWLFGYFLNFLKMVILELRYSGTEPSIVNRLFLVRETTRVIDALHIFRNQLDHHHLTNFVMVLFFFVSTGEVDAKSIAMTMASLANSGTAAKTNTVANGLDAQRMAAKPKEVSILILKYSLQVFNSVK